MGSGSDAMYLLLMQSCILVLLPLIPAYILFKLLPSKGEGRGTFAGFDWKFGGAFAAYLMIFLLLWSAMRRQMELRDTEVWTVRGRIEAEQLPAMENLFLVKSVPQMVTYEADGTYEFKIFVRRMGEQLEFPRLILDMRRACGGIVSLTLDNTPGTFKALPSAPQIKVKKYEATRSFEVEPIKFTPVPSFHNCAEGNRND